MQQKNIIAYIYEITDKEYSSCSGSCHLKQLHWLVKQECKYHRKVNIFAKYNYYKSFYFFFKVII